MAQVKVGDTVFPVWVADGQLRAGFTPTVIDVKDLVRGRDA
jgi:hypothetical protein